MRTYVWRGFLIIGASVLAWTSLVQGVSGYYANRVIAGDESLIETVLTWNPAHSATLVAKAYRLLATDPDQAAELLEHAHRVSPMSPFPLIGLAAQAAAAGEDDRGDALISLASRIAPVDPRVQQAVADYWADRGRYDLMLAHWSTALEADATRRERLFPQMLAIAENPDARALFDPLLASPPSWWNGYFRYVTRTARDLDTVRYLYASRRQSARVPVSPEEREDFVLRLQRDGAVSEAYVTWLSGLDANERRHLGLLHDGGFELPIENRSFGWRVGRHNHFTADPAPTLGASGRAALRVRFRGFEGRFGHISQALLLDAGTYRLSGRVRVDSLVSQGGVRWSLRCLLPQSGVIGEGPRFLGSADWSEFDFRFEVPPDCIYQQLVLVTAGTRDFERRLNGTIWFDDLRISRVADLDATARAEALLRERSASEPTDGEADGGATVEAEEGNGAPDDAEQGEASEADPGPEPTP